jgi:rhombotail lipoprotein
VIKTAKYMNFSSVVDFLYPKGSSIVVEPTVPTLNIPVKVGIAFVPEKLSRSRGVTLWSRILGGDLFIIGGGELAEAEKSDLLEKVADNFRKYEFVSEIEVIPSAYLTEGGSFQNLDQIRTIYGIDIIALVSYDQVQFTDEGLLSLTYWTLVGAYVVSGEKNDTSTMLDTAVYDIESRNMLFRAPGTSKIKGRSTPINLSEELREDSINGFKEAAAKMTANLDLQLTNFREKIKEEPERVKLVHRKGFSGVGALGVIEGIFILLSVVILLARHHYR